MGEWWWWWREQRAGLYGILAQSSEDRCTLWLNRWFTEQCLQQLRGLIRDRVLHLRTSGEVFLYSSWSTAPLQVVGDVQRSPTTAASLAGPAVSQTVIKTDHPSCPRLPDCSITVSERSPQTDTRYSSTSVSLRSTRRKTAATTRTLTPAASPRQTRLQIASWTWRYFAKDVLGRFES